MIADSRDLEGAFRGDFFRGMREPRVAFVGRSNVGKSSLINALLGATLARTSNQPGKTREIHFYQWPEARLLVADLPGYGYAKVSATKRDRWAKFIGAYLQADPALVRIAILLDARHGPTPIDEVAIEFLSLARVPVTLIFSKCDELRTQSERVKRRREAISALGRLGQDGESAHWVSARTGDGIDGLRGLLRDATSGPEARESGKGEGGSC